MNAVTALRSCESRGTHRHAVVDEQRDLQRVVVARHAQNFARLAVFADDEILDGEVEDRRAVLVDDAGVDDALVGLSVERRSGRDERRRAREGDGA